MDSLHFYLYHCFHTGLRTKTNQTRNKTKIDNKYVDTEFRRANELISNTTQITKRFARFSTQKNNKFVIKPLDEQIENAFLDELVEYLFECLGNTFSQIQTFYDLIISEEYDTESTEFDIDINYGNIWNLIPNNQFIKNVKHFYHDAQIASSSFSIGLRFYYWRFYSTLKETPYNEDKHNWNKNDHSGHTVCNLYIKPKYTTFKEEISNYKYISCIEYKKNVCMKVNKYLQTNIVKSTIASSHWSVPYLEHYCIDEEAPLKFEHLLVLVFYCDYTDLSTDFSSSFRKMKKFETLNQIKKRNGEYYYFSKYLRECVEVYGQCSGWDDNGDLRGPFFSGISMVMNMPSFNIRLCAPTSTSIQIEVAIKFSTTDGMIIEFDTPNNSPQHKYLKAFNVSWISRYKSEDERLFFGGFYFTKIVSVRIRSSNENFEKFMHALYYLDTMVTGGKQKHIEADKHDILVIKHLFHNVLNRYSKVTEKLSEDLSPYIYSTFTTFIHSKKQIVLDLFELHSKANSKIRDLIMYRMDSENNASHRADNDDCNLFRNDLCLIFKNAKTILIRTTDRDGKKIYSFSMKSLLSIIDSGNI
eukprot:382001_1